MRLDKVLSKSTPGPLSVSDDTAEPNYIVSLEGIVMCSPGEAKDQDDENLYNAHLLAHCRNHLPAVLDVIAKAADDIRKLRTIQGANKEVTFVDVEKALREAFDKAMEVEIG